MAVESGKVSLLVDALIEDQLRDWPLARNNYTDLEKIMVRSVALPAGSRIMVQFNPGRIRSSAAKVDNISIAGRPCFLCRPNLPPDQKWVDYNGSYRILVNPFPIFPRHLTIALNSHKDQKIEGYFNDMLQLARELEGFTVFYNGPRCGASAPDHFHFQAGNKGFLPVEEECLLLERKLLYMENGAMIESLEDYHRYTLIISGNTAHAVTRCFKVLTGLLAGMQLPHEEPMMNILAGWYEAGWRVIVFPRGSHRPSQYFEEGDSRILISPASVDFGGVWITPREEDFNKVDKGNIVDIFNQVSIDKDQWNKLIKSINHAANN